MMIIVVLVMMITMAMTRIAESVPSFKWRIMTRLLRGKPSSVGDFDLDLTKFHDKTFCQNVENDYDDDDDDDDDDEDGDEEDQGRLQADVSGGRPRCNCCNRKDVSAQFLCVIFILISTSILE